MRHIKKRHRFAVTKLLSVFALLGCNACVKYPTAKAPTIYYGATFQVDASALTEDADQQRVEVLTNDAPTLLRKGVRIAFLPPDSCVTTTASPLGASQKGFIRMECGVLISGLETAVALNGYEVISWQTLKGPGDMLKRAAAMGVDVIFEIDQLSINDGDKGRVRATGISLFRQSDATNRTPIAVSSLVGQNCKVLADKLVAEIGTDEISATFSTKAVDVKTGRAIWYFQKTVRDDSGDEAVQRSVDLYFGVEPLAQSPKMNGKQSIGKNLQLVGYLGTLLGAGLYYGSTQEEEDDPETATELRDWSTRSLLVGIPALIVGTGLVLAGNAEHGGHKAEYPAAGSVLCTTEPVTPEFAMVASASGTEGAGLSSSFSYESHQRGNTDERRKIEERLFKLTSDDFIGELQSLASRAVPATPASPLPLPSTSPAPTQTSTTSDI